MKEAINMLTDKISSIVDSLAEELDSITKEINELPDGYLSYYTDGKLIKYTHNYNLNNKRARNTIESKSDLLSNLVRKNYLKKRASAINHNIDLFKKIASDYRDMDLDSILKRSAEVYRLVPKILNSPIATQDALAWMSEPYERDMSYNEHNVIPTSYGIKVKSKSEKDILEALMDEGIPFHYEEVMYIENKKIAPDFKIKRLSDGEFVYWEHFGRMHDANYRRIYFWKMSMFEKAGIIPGKNLIVTFEGGGQFVSNAEIKAIINSKLK